MATLSAKALVRMEVSPRYRAVFLRHVLGQDIAIGDTDADSGAKLIDILILPNVIIVELDNGDIMTRRFA